jgi:hypothetical protein
MSGKSVRLLAVLAGVLGVTMTVRATVVVSNLDGSPQTGFAWNSSTALQGSAFTLDSTFAPTQLTAITLRMRASVNITNPIPVTLKLYNNSGNHPGSQLVNMGTVNVENVEFPFDYSFTPQSPFTIQPGSKYWVVVAKGGSTAASLVWYTTTASPDPGSDPAAAIPLGIAMSGPPWTIFPNTGKFKIEGEPVPEPASVMLLAVGALALRGRRKLCR